MNQTLKIQSQLNCSPASTMNNDSRKQGTIRSKMGLGLAILLFVFMIWIIHEANIGRDNFIFQFVRATPHGDKIGHFLIAGLLTVAANFTLRYRSWSLKGMLIPYGSLIIFALFMAEEASQALLPTRTLDARDAAANGIGILIFSMLQKRKFSEKRPNRS